MTGAGLNGRRCLSAFALALAGALLWDATAGSAALAGELHADIARGGRLYDNWRTELDLHQRHISHLPRPDQSGAAAEGDGRCVTCHGWDYRGVPWAEGGPITGMAGADPADVVAVLTDQTHGYGTFMDDTDLRDLALFVTQGQVDMDQWIVPGSGAARGDAERGGRFVQTICAGCHGSDGMAVEDMPPLGPFSRQEPWHAFHVMLNGHPNGSMPPLGALDLTDLADSLAALQALPERLRIVAVTRGGRLYESWPDELNSSVPKGWHPAWPQDHRAAAEDIGGSTLASAQRRSWTCSACHGWDYRGRDGQALGGEPAPFGGLHTLANGDPDAIAAAIGDETHAYDRLLGPREIQDLAAFVAWGQVDMAPYLHPDSGRFVADGTGFAGTYHTVCATCHGDDGRAIRTMPPLGRVVQSQPQHALHSVFNGHAGEEMPPLRAIGLDVAAGVLAYAQALPTSKR